MNVNHQSPTTATLMQCAQIQKARMSAAAGRDMKETESFARVIIRKHIYSFCRFGGMIFFHMDCLFVVHVLVYIYFITNRVLMRQLQFIA